MSVIANRQPKEKKPTPVETPIIYADIEYTIWKGTDRNIKPEMRTAKAIVKGNSVYTLDGKKKRADGKYLTIFEGLYSQT